MTYTDVHREYHPNGCLLLFSVFYRGIRGMSVYHIQKLFPGPQKNLVDIPQCYTKCNTQGSDVQNNFCIK